MGKRIEIKSGDKYNRLTFIKEVEKKNKSRMVECKCDCGKIIVIYINRLINGHTKSCGCYRKDYNRKRYFIHGKEPKRLYNIWCNMRRRCNPKYINSRHYKYYVLKNIKVCDSWLNYITFRDWALSNGYKDNLTIERINNNSNYEPDNCTWIPQSEQTKNSSHNVMILYEDKFICLSDYCKKMSISRSTYYWRLKKLCF